VNFHSLGIILKSFIQFCLKRMLDDLEDLGRHVFGPVPSRRLGRSLGINNIPPKSCSYSCVYCQLGKTIDMIIERKSFYKPEDIFNQVKKKLNEAILSDERARVTINIQ
jgi:wyosine [tRNA(Phe)-imidazoG37] synthetase (radical SAM superfamily)